MPDDPFALRLSHEIVVPRPIGPVFDVATVARHWTDWHPATLRVEGQVEEPARLGDRITEYVRVADRVVRILSLPPLPAPVEAAMHTQSAAGLTALGALLEREIPATG
jgi:hypothetical protein